MERDITPQLTAAEVGFLWSHYMGNSLNLGAMKVFLAKVEDKETEMVLRYGYEAALKIEEAIAALLAKEGDPLPRGFGDGDVDLGAPRLFEDTGTLYYAKRMVKLAMPAAEFGLVNATRAAARAFRQCLYLGRGARGGNGLCSVLDRSRQNRASSGRAGRRSCDRGLRRDCGTGQRRHSARGAARLRTAPGRNI